MIQSERNIMIAVNQPRFSLGQVVATPAVLQTLKRLGQNVLEFIERHVRGDWGDLSEDDQQANERCAGRWKPHSKFIHT